MDPPVPASPVDNRLAWTLAFTPLIMIVVDIILALNSVADTGLSTLIALGLNVGLAVADRNLLRRAGVSISAWLAGLLAPVYLFVRSSRLHQNKAIPITWCVSTLVAFGGAGIVSNIAGVTIDTKAVEQQIEKTVLQQRDTQVNVQCPDTVTVKPGSSFTCIATSRDGEQVTVKVTVQNSNGDIIWQTE